MFQKAREKAYLESTSILFLLIRWRKPLIIITLLTSVAAYIFSGPIFIKPKYLSSVIFFPSATNSISKAILEESISDKQDILAFGEEEQAEQMLQILNSDEIRDVIIRKYDLFKHYEIRPDEPYPVTRLHEKFKKNITFSRTEFLSVRIDVFDTDPETAAAIANDIASLVDSVKNKIQHARANDALTIAKHSYEGKLIAIKEKEDSLQKICKLGVMDFFIQSEILNKEQTQVSAMHSNEIASLSVLQKYKAETDTAVLGTKARIAGAEARLRYLNEKLAVLARYGGASVSLNEQLKLDREELAKSKRQYDKLNVDVNQNLSSKFIVNNAVKSEKKAYPNRWLIVVVSVALALMLSIVVISIFERVRELKYNL